MSEQGDQSTETARKCVAVIGGTGNLGRGLAARWAEAGLPVIIGSRSPEKAEACAAAIRAEAAGANLRGLGNAAAAAAAEIVVVAVPYAAHKATLEEIRAAVQGKIVVDATVPLKPPKVARVNLPPEGSAARAAQDLLGAEVQVVSAFHNIAAAHLGEPGGHVDCDVLVFGDSPAARQAVVGLVEAIGLRGWHAGPIDNAVVGEALTSSLIFINRHYKISGAGIRVTGLAHD